jgi:Ala-tRNA(Pro) deacylase
MIKKIYIKIENMKDRILWLLDDLKISYTNYEHNPTFTCDDCKWLDIPGKRVKSLLLNNKKKTQFYMVVLEDEKRLDSSIIRKSFWEPKVSFISEERMKEKIWVTPGHVSPFALINNEEKDIKVIMDSELKWQELWFHPGRNDNTVVLNNSDVEKYLEKLWFEVYFMDL